MAPETGETIKFLRILILLNAFEPSLHLFADCSNVELNTFSSKLEINDIVADNNTLSLIHSKTPFTDSAKTKSDARANRKLILWLFITGPKTILI